jgi:hypothetical protein
VIQPENTREVKPKLGGSLILKAKQQFGKNARAESEEQL